MNTSFFGKIKNFIVSKYKILIVAVVVLLLASYFVFSSQKTNSVNTDTVKYADLSRDVKATGQVVSKTDLSLSFNKASVVKSVSVSVGDHVTAGQSLATLDQGQALATLTQAKGALLGAEAKYNKILNGATNEEIKLAEVALKNAQNDLENVKNNQENLVTNAYGSLLNSTLSAESTSTSSTQSAPTISGTYKKGQEGVITISVYQGGNGGYFSTSGLVTSSGVVSSTTPQPIGDSGLYIQFSSNTSTYQGDWSISIPNQKASNYLTNLNAYNSALKTQTSAVGSASSLVDQRQAELDLKKAKATNTDLDIAQSDVLQAQGNLQGAQSAYDDTIIRAPASGTITSVDIKYGEMSQIGKSVITLEDIDNLYIEALINEANIAYLKVGQNANVTFDAFGKDKNFTGIVAEIDPSAQTNNGVVNYKIKVSINEKDVTIRPGMNANVTISAGGVSHVLSIPFIAVVKKNDKSYVSVVTDDKNNGFTESPVSTGFLGDNNLVEIVSGLSLGDKIVIPSGN